MSKSTCCRDCTNRLPGTAKCAEFRDQCQRTPDKCNGVAEGKYTASNKCFSCHDFKLNNLYANAEHELQAIASRAPCSC